MPATPTPAIPAPSYAHAVTAGHHRATALFPVRLGAHDPLAASPPATPATSPPVPSSTAPPWRSGGALCALALVSPLPPCPCLKRRAAAKHQEWLLSGSTSVARHVVRIQGPGVRQPVTDGQEQLPSLALADASASVHPALTCCSDPGWLLHVVQSLRQCPMARSRSPDMDDAYQLLDEIPPRIAEESAAVPLVEKNTG